MNTKVPPDWMQELQPLVDWVGFEATLSIVQAAREANPGRVYPPADEVFKALELTPFSSVLAVILGQDPYPRRDQAHGLAFSLRAGASPFPGSLTNILDEVERDYGRGARDGSLVPWARQGVLLLNTALTVVDGSPGSHLQVWSPFTDAVIKALALREAPVVFMLWGKMAAAKTHLITQGRHLVHVRSHPSWRSAYRNFRNTAPFKEANEALRGLGLREVRWTL